MRTFNFEYDLDCWYFGICPTATEMHGTIAVSQSYQKAIIFEDVCRDWEMEPGREPSNIFAGYLFVDCFNYVEILHIGGRGRTRADGEQLVLIVLVLALIQHAISEY